MYFPFWYNQQKSIQNFADIHGLARTYVRGIGFWIVGFIVLVLIAVGVFIQGPSDFPEGSIVSVREGQTLLEASEALEKHNIIRSAFVLRMLIISSKGDRSVIAGDYLFDERIPVTRVAKRISSGDFGASHTRVIIHEGTSLAEMAEIFEEKFEGFDSEEFIEITEGLEGYLFPDTYFFFPSITTERITEEMRDNFNRAIRPLLPDIEESEKTLEEIVIMASIVERESGNNNEERKIIAGILWKRIDKGMLLQVDAPFVYAIGKGSADLTISDLRDGESLYNTYVHEGLTPTPIGSPGLASIKAALSPKDSPYFYFLHDRNGNVHYAKTFNQHKSNKRLYLP